jgi:hypothetical protein
LSSLGKNCAGELSYRVLCVGLLESLNPIEENDTMQIGISLQNNCCYRDIAGKQRAAGIPDAIAAKEGTRLGVYRQEDPQGLAERQLVVEFDLQEVKTWFPVSDTHR